MVFGGPAGPRCEPPVMIFPQRRKRDRYGIDRGPRLVWPHHEKWVRGFGCSVPGCKCTPIRCHHLRNAANSSTSKKPHSAFVISLCDAHHDECHKGEKTFAEKYGLSLYAIAGRLLRHSPDRAMRESFHELPAHVQRPLLEAA